MSKVGDVLAVTCLAIEAYIARGPKVAVICNHAVELKVSLTAAMSHGVAGIISFGIAGGLVPHLRPGDWVVASEIKTPGRNFVTDRTWTQELLDALPGATHDCIAGADRVVSTPEAKALLHSRTGAAAVDMESHIAADFAAQHGLPFATCRVIIDPAERVVPPAAIYGLHADGTPNIGAVLRSLLKAPAQLPDLLRTAGDSFIATRSLRLGRKRLGAGLAFPY